MFKNSVLSSLQSMASYNRKLLSKELPKPGSDSQQPNSGSDHQIPSVLVLSLGIVGAVFLLLSYFTLRRLASRRRSSPPPPLLVMSHTNAEEIDHPVWYIRTIGLPQSVVDSIQMVSYKRGEGLIESSHCSVCLSDFDEGDRLRLLPKCGHSFHVACIDTWLRSHTNCPLCRAPVNGNQPSSSEGEGEDDGVVNEIHQIEAVRRSVSMDLSSNVEPDKHFPINRSISFTFHA